MKIGLIDIDGRNFPNLALMKVSAFHKLQGDSVEWVNHFFEYDKVYRSKIFTFSPDNNTSVLSPITERGGTGYNIATKLPTEIENFQSPDYSIYPQFRYSISYHCGASKYGMKISHNLVPYPIQEGAEFFVLD